MIEQDIDEMLKKTKEFKDNLSYHDKNLERIMQKYKLKNNKGEIRKKKVSVNDFLKEVKTGKIRQNKHKDCYRLMDELRKELRINTLETLQKNPDFEPKIKSNLELFKNKNIEKEDLNLEERSIKSIRSEKSRNRLEALKKKFKRDPSPKLKNLKQVYHKRDSVDKNSKPPIDSEFFSSKSLLNENNSIPNLKYIRKFKKSICKSEVIYNKQNKNYDQSEDENDEGRGYKTDRDWDEILKEEKEEINEEEIKISFLTQNNKKSLIMDESLGLLEYSRETTGQIGIVQPGNRLSTIKIEEGERKALILKKIQGLLQKKMKLENEISTILG